MSMAPTIYRYDDPGAPVITDTRDSYYEVLLACLINGYGSKDAAGWGVVNDAWQSDGVLSITNALQTGVLGVVRPPDTSQGAGVFIAEAMASGTAVVNARSGVQRITDVGEIFSASQGLTQKFIRQQSASHWCVVANENMAVMFFARYATGILSPEDQSNSQMGWIAFGAGKNLQGLSDDQLGNFCVMGGGEYSQKLSHQGYASANVSNASTIFYNKNGVIGSESLAAALVPFRHVNQTYQSSYTRFLPMAPVHLMDTTDGNDYRGRDVMYFPQILTCEQMLTETYAQGRDGYRKLSPSPARAFDDVVDIDGRAMVGVCFGLWCYGFVSLDGADWL